MSHGVDFSRAHIQKSKVSPCVKANTTSIITHLTHLTKFPNIKGIHKFTPMFHPLSPPLSLKSHNYL
jgi:hypothetical protein